MEQRSPWVGNVVWLGLALWIGFIPFIWYLPRQELFEVLNAIVFSVASGIVVGYAPGVWKAISSDIRDLHSGDALQIGILVGWAATAFIFGVLWWWRLSGKGDPIVDHGLNAFSRWVLITAGFLHLAASGSIQGRIPLQSYLRAGVLTSIGIIMGVVVVTIAHGKVSGL